MFEENLEGLDVSSEAPTPSTSTVRSIERAFDILEILRQSRAPLRLSDIARESGNHLATTQRILNVLVRSGYVLQERNMYSIGITSLLNAHAYLISNNLIQVALPIVQELVTMSGLATSFSVRVGFRQILLMRIDGNSPLRYQLPVGEPMPLHLGGARIHAAWLERDELELFLKELPEIRLATGEFVSRDEFVEQLGVIRAQGFVCGYSQRELGAASAAVPVFGQDGKIIASLQVSGMADELDSEKMEWSVVELKRASAAIERRVW